MTVSEYLIDNLEERAYGPANFYFWVRTVVDAMRLAGPETAPELERLTALLLNYYSGADIAAEEIDDIRRELYQSGFNYGWRNATPLDLKYRCIWNIASSREANLSDLYNWQYGVVTAFQNINLNDDKDDALIALVRANASRYEANLYEHDKSD